MKFTEYRSLMQEHFYQNMANDTEYLFEVEADKDEVWNLYLDSFLPKYNKIFRERRAHDCSCCRQFVKNFGAVVKIKNNKITSIWDFQPNSEEYSPVVKAMSEYIHSKIVSNVYINKFKKIGTDKNFEKLDNGKILTWEHFYLELPSQFVDKSSKSEGDLRGRYRDVRNVFKRSLDEITEEAVMIVLELVVSNTLYKGQEWKNQLQEFLKHQKEYNKLSKREKEIYAWEKSVEVGAVIGKIKNHSIGVLLTDISEGMDLDNAVKRYEKIVAPSNYKRPKPIYTKAMLEKAKNKIQELGYMESLSRRYAEIDDITINNVLFCNRESSKKIGGLDIFEEMKNEVAVNPKKFSKVEEIGIDKFINDILPVAKEIEVLFENKHSQNMVSLIAPKVKDSKSMFKWNNNFSWAYTGNVTDSLMKERVKSAGGKVDGDLRFSIQWNDIGRDSNDYDAHCLEPNGYEIYFSNKRKLSPNKGILDIDIIKPIPNEPSVENITYADRKTMQDGEYKFYMNPYSGKSTNGFRAEIEFDGNIYSFDCRENIKRKKLVATVTLKNGIFTIKENIKSNLSSKDVWGLKTNQFVPISIIMTSPNYWDGQKEIGHKHIFFMLKDCINSEMPNAFYNEFLNQELNEHRKVMEALGSKMRVEDNENQLSGVGFSTTKRSEIVVKVKGNTERILKIKF